MRMHVAPELFEHRPADICPLRQPPAIVAEPGCRSSMFGSIFNRLRNDP
jgi:hypothetical protein